MKTRFFAFAQSRRFRGRVTSNRRPHVENLEGRSLLAISLAPIGTYATGIFNGSAAEIVAHDRETQQLFVVNFAEASIDVLDIRDPSDPTLVNTIDLSSLGSPNSAAFHRNVLAVALEDLSDNTLPGKVAFFKANGQMVNVLTVGSLPDMVTFTPDGKYLLVANEGQPNDAYTVDPQGSVSIIPIDKRGIGNVRTLVDADVVTAGFEAFNDDLAALKAAGVRIFGPGATVAEDLEPEFIAVSDDSQTAYVTLQENNAYATVDIATGTVTEIVPFGYKDFSSGDGLDASDRDNEINITNWPVSGMYQPDAIVAYTVAGETYLLTANEGDARAYTGFSEEVRVGDLTLDPIAFPDAASLQQNANLGRLRVTNQLGDKDQDGDFDALYAYGGRSFSIWDLSGQQVFDSGGDFEQITAAAFPAFFNASNANNNFDDRSDDKGPEPEDVALGVVEGRTYAFIALERIGGVMVYDVTDPSSPSFVQYINNRDFTQPVNIAAAKDLGPEGMVFISAHDSPTHTPLLVVANEVSGTTTIFEITSSAATAAHQRSENGRQFAAAALPTNRIILESTTPTETQTSHVNRSTPVNSAKQRQRFWDQIAGSGHDWQSPRTLAGLGPTTVDILMDTLGDVDWNDLGRLREKGLNG
jgi:2',3'-cyclic-nucleotide 2'-phosphodiesterase/3'-nucleotidase/5'-nucleotidase